MQLTLTLKMTTTEVVETSVTVNSSPSDLGLRSPGRSSSTPPPGGGGGANQPNFYTGRFHPEVQPLTLLYTII